MKTASNHRCTNQKTSVNIAVQPHLLLRKLVHLIMVFSLLIPIFHTTSYLVAASSFNREIEQQEVPSTTRSFARMSPFINTINSEMNSGSLAISVGQTAVRNPNINTPTTLWLSDYTNQTAVYSKDGSVFSASALTGWYQIRAIASVPGNKKIAYYLTESNGADKYNALWKTIDGGNTFSLTNLPVLSSQLSLYQGTYQDVFVNPANPQEVFVFWAYDENSNNWTHVGALYRSVDGGLSWTKMPNIGQGGNYVINDSYGRALMNPNGTIILIGNGSMRKSGFPLDGGVFNAVIWRSTNHGQSWTLEWNNEWQFGSVYRLSYSLHHPSTWYATVAVDYEVDGLPTGVVVSADDGLTWNFHPVFQVSTRAEWQREKQ
jgi:hypothetical protein